ncbi:hypoxanthine phosphoribosyltransferase [Alkalibaculum sp. M08DMB]|uniref:Hypoxanthine phosphoribosyltransferase n=1 Tax=Alkalibaculum sporogenes TaxID=2655001 RepID=A0A6A7KCY7_9FIRM|nr:hypoxanthine phosphoribosyltransferase [Alkalibaculum sporogenes]MPW27181.1 hypoxanthine phosphoribosyltransferase [Alkalibaculum sporogenes]
MRKDIKEILINEVTLQRRIDELGVEITKDYEGKNPLIICVLKGAVLFMADLVQRIDTTLEMDFMAISSYGDSTKTSGQVRILKDLEKSVENRDILIVEDIVDSGLTLAYIINLLRERNANSIKVCTLLEKPARRVAQVKMDYIGFEVPDEFVVGYGLDYAERYRNLPYIGILKEEIYNT